MARPEVDRGYRSLHTPAEASMISKDDPAHAEPLNNMFRTATVDAEIGARKIPAGGRVCLLYPSANRDDAFFHRPDEIDLRREPNPHVAFGLGTHFCLGANLARLTLRVFFEELAARIERVEALAPPVYEANVFIKGVRRFDARLRGRGSA